MYDKEDIANTFNEFFSNIGSSLAKKKIKKPKRKYKQPESVNGTIFLKPTSSSEIYKILQEMKDKNGGIDGINTGVNNLSENIILPLVHIFRRLSGRQYHLRIWLEKVPIRKPVGECTNSRVALFCLNLRSKMN